MIQLFSCAARLARPLLSAGDMTPRGTLSVSSLLFMSVLGLGCSSAPPPGDTPDVGRGDAGSDASVGDDASGDAARDAGTGCIQASAGPWRLDFIDDVAVSYSSILTPMIGGVPYSLNVLMERYDVPYVGSFPLTGDDANRGTCAHCIAAYTGTDMSRGFFAESGTLQLDTDPYTLRLDATLTDVRLVEVTIEADATGAIHSVPVPGGRCIEIPSLEVDDRFAPDNWRCSADLYADGSDCQCNCGVYDPDCADGRAAVDCAASTLCEIRPPDGGIIDPSNIQTFCAPTCSREEARGCGGGACVPDGYARTYCDTTPDLVSDASLGEVCELGARYCAPVDASFFDGVCDDIRGDAICRPLCTADDDCDAAAFERCVVLFTSDTASFGFCSPRHPIGWTCSPAAFGDGATCNCGCGDHDSDCDLPDAPVDGCPAGVACEWSGTCA
jgi:hypothetical protein